jgi:hypothetical protein
MQELSKLNNLLDAGFSVITIGEGKIPNFKWKKYQDKKITKSELENKYNLSSTKGFGIVTGYDYLEVVDVDLKVLSTAKEQKEFWELLYTYLEDSIIDFKDKFVIAKTKNKGFHILYKTKRVGGNQKVAKLKGHTEAIIETRGKKGYVFVYDKFLNNKYYSDIDFVSDDDRTILFDICDSFDYKDAKPIEAPKREKKTYSEGIKPWEDFNDKNSVWDIVSDEFSIVRQQKDRMVIKRNGAESTHSGYIFNDNGCLYLHSTGSSYPHEKQVSAFDAYTIKFHQNDYSSAAKKVYADGYGDRLKLPEPEIKEKILKEKISNDIDFPLDIYPKPFQKYIMDCAETLDSSIDYMGCSLLWNLSVIVGNSAKIEVKKNWIETPIVWIACVGKAGIGKTPSISNITRPLEKENQTEIRRFFEKLEKFEYFDGLSKEEKKYAENVSKPNKTQFIANDITSEALIQMHQQSKNCVGVFKDELAGWFKDMNKYREGSDLELWLSSWSGKSINLNRVSVTSNAFLPNPFMPVLGGIQPSILNNFYTDENKDNGFIDRVLLSFPDLKVEKYNDNEMSAEVIDWYNTNMINLYRLIKKDATYDENDQIEPTIFSFSEDAKKEWKRIFNKITKKQNSDNMNEYMKSMLPKQKSYIPRFSLLIHLLRIHCGQENNDNLISKETILLAEKLSDYFVLMSQKIKINAKEIKSLKGIAMNDKLSNQEKINMMHKLDEDFNKSEAAELLGVSRTMIYKYIKNIK